MIVVFVHLVCVLYFELTRIIIRLSSNIVPKILPNCIQIYEGLMKTYQHNEEDDSDDETDEDDDSVASGKVD